MRSYYDILNVLPDASKAEIKKQYRKLVRIYHPDINSSAEAQEIFKLINQAAEVLLDDEKRRIYDIFNKRKKKTPPKLKSQKGEDITLDIEISLQESILGTVKIINIAQSSICPKCKGYKFINSKKCPICEGSGEITQTRKITLKIPPMIKNKAVLRLKEEGHRGKNGGKNGNLYVTVKIKSEKDLTIKEGVVYYSAKISPSRAVLGGTIKVLTLWGEAEIKIPPLTKANQRFKLIEAGVFNEKTQKKGDEIVNILIQIPDKLTSKELKLYEELQQIANNKNNVRTG